MHLVVPRELEDCPAGHLQVRNGFLAPRPREREMVVDGTGGTQRRAEAPGKSSYIATCGLGLGSS